MNMKMDYFHSNDGARSGYMTTAAVCLDDEGLYNYQWLDNHMETICG